LSGARAAVGRLGERIAAERLTQAGLRIVASNWRCPYGEIDLVARDGPCLVIVEVRTRTTERFGPPEESVDHRKRARLRHLGEQYVRVTGWTGPWRIDVVAIEMAAGGAVRRFAHYPSAIGAG
jgi:putative endonuclease